MNDEDCHYNTTIYMIVGILHSCSAAISFISSILVITIIVLFKKSKFFSQRLVLYLSFAVALYSLAAALAKTDYVHPEDKFCKWIAFISQYTQWTLLLAVCVITVDILLRIVWDNHSDWATATPYLEVFYCFVIFVFPGTFNWLPFYWNYYGISGDWCWIRDKIPDTNGSCHDGKMKATMLQMGLWYIPLFVLCCLILVAYIVIVLLLRRQRRRMSIYNPDEIQLLRTMRNEIYSIFWYPIVFMIINLFPLTNRIVTSLYKPVIALWVLHAVISPLQGGFMSLVYALDPETRRMLTPSSIRAAIVGFCNCRKDRVFEYHAVIEKEQKSFSERSKLLPKNP